MPKKKQKLMGLREYARHRKVRLSTVQDAIAKGRISVVMERGKKKIDPSKADREFDQNTDPSKQNRKPDSEPRPPQTQSTEANPESSNKPKAPTYQSARTMREAYSARLQKLEWEKRSGEVIQVKSVRVQAFQLARTVRDAILNVPDRIAAILAAETDPRIVHDLLSKELKSALQELVNAARIAEKK